MKTWIALTLAAAVAAGGYATSRAAEDSVPRNPAHARMLQHIKEKLDLSDDQVAQIREVLKSDRSTLTDVLTRLHAARKDLRSAIRSDNATEASVRSASAKVAAVEADFAVERLRLYGKISPILTDAQRQKLSQMMAGLDDAIDRFIQRASAKLAD
jgi:Spy/CpxP family protein refolding chaperone